MRFLPKLYKEIISIAHRIGMKIMSARSMFEGELPSKYSLVLI
jgi:hypothetical protein